MESWEIAGYGRRSAKEQRRDYVRTLLRLPEQPSEEAIETLTKYMEDNISHARMTAVCVMLFIAFLVWGFSTTHVHDYLDVWGYP
jgi:hypothetical protein